SFAVVATHTYAAEGTYTAFVTVGDPGGNVAPVATTVAVLDTLDTIVTNTNDGGRGSLRQAILNANLLPGTNTITFRIGGLAPGQGNVISGNAGFGIDFKNDGSFGSSGFHLVLGNLIGLDPTGTQARG